MGASAWSVSMVPLPHVPEADEGASMGRRRGAPQGEAFCHFRMLNSPEETLVKLVVGTGTASKFSLIGLINLGLLGLS